MVYIRHGHCPLRTDRQTDRHREMETKGYDCDIPYAGRKLYLKSGVGCARAMLSALRLQQQRQRQRQQRGRGRCHPLTTTASFACDTVCGKHVGPVALRETLHVCRNSGSFPYSVSEILCPETHFYFLQVCRKFCVQKRTFICFKCVTNFVCRKAVSFPLSV